MTATIGHPLVPIFVNIQVIGVLTWNGKKHIL